MTLFSEKDHALLLKDPALTVVTAEGRPQIVLPYRLGAFQPPLPRKESHTIVRQGQSTMNGVPVVQLSVPPLNGNAAPNQHQMKTMAPPVMGPQMRISSNGGMRPSTANAPHGVAPPQPIPIPVAQHSPASRAAIAMPYVDVQNPEVVTPDISNSMSQPDANAELTSNGSPARPKAQNLTSQHGGPSNGLHLTSMTNLTTPTINSAFGQNQPHTGGLSFQQMQNLKTAFANIPAPDLAALQNVGRAISASYMNLAVNGANMNLQHPAANMKMSPQMQRAMNSASFQKSTSGVNGTDGSTIAANSMLGNSISSSPSGLRSPAANEARTPPRNGVHINGQHSQPTSSPLLNNAQAVKTTQNSF
jgi:enhancer of polycomb-like protein